MGSSIMFVTHDMSVHAAIADRIGIVYAGRLVEEGPTTDVFARPQHPYTAHLIASLPRLGDPARRTGAARASRRTSAIRRPAAASTRAARWRSSGARRRSRRWCRAGAGRVACWRAGEATLDMSALLELDGVTKTFSTGGLSRPDQGPRRSRA